MKGLKAILVFLVLLVTSCNKKPLPEPSTEEPDFYLDCYLSGQKLEREAGNIDYYMNTSYFLDSTTNVYVVKGELSKACSGGCDYGFTVLINDFKPAGYGASMDINNTLQIGAYSYNDKLIVPDSFKVQLSPVEQYSPGTTYDWTVTGSSSEFTGRNYSLAATFITGSTYTVKLKIDDISGCSTEHTRVYKIGGTQGNIQATRNSLTDLNFSFTCDVPDAPGNQYSWDFGDGQTASGRTVSHTYSPSLNSNWYYAKLTIITAANETIVLDYQIPGTIDKICIANFNSSIVPVPKTSVLSRVTVIVTDPSGKKFTTRNVEQPSTSTFYIDEVSDYQTNNSGEPTKKLKIRLNCVLRDGTSEIQLVEGKASIAVAYK